MTLQRRMAVTLPARRSPGSSTAESIEDTVARIRWAEDNGYTDGWFSDSGAPDTLTMAAGIAHRTRSLRIGVAVTPVYTRTPAVLAATINVLAELYPRRFVMGLGASSQTIMESWHGVRLEKPVTRVRETALMVRSMLKGERSDFDYETLHSHGYRQVGLAETPPIYLAALRPKMIETAAEVGDGVILNLWPKSALPRMMQHVRIGAERAGKDWRNVEVVNRAMVLVTDDKVEGRNRFRAAFAPYYATPVYNQFLAWSGFPDAARAIAEGWASKDRTRTTGALSNSLIDEIAIIGNEDECRARLREDADGGVHTHIVAPIAGTPAELDRTYAAFTPKHFSLD